jgi:hypothetical protein
MCYRPDHLKRAATTNAGTKCGARLRLNHGRHFFPIARAKCLADSRPTKPRPEAAKISIIRFISFAWQQVLDHSSGPPGKLSPGPVVACDDARRIREAITHFIGKFSPTAAPDGSKNSAPGFRRPTRTRRVESRLPFATMERPCAPPTLFDLLPSPPSGAVPMP